MDIVRFLTIALLLITGVAHMIPLAMSAATQITVGMFVFGIMYLATGLRVVLGSRAALQLGRILPIVGLALAVPGVLRGTMQIDALTATLFAIDVVLIVLCSLLLARRDLAT